MNKDNCTERCRLLTTNGRYRFEQYHAYGHELAILVDDFLTVCGKRPSSGNTSEYADVLKIDGWHE